MNPIQYALSKVSQRIPPAILKGMFETTTNRTFNWARMHAPMLSVDHQLRDKVVEGIVMPDINLISGQRELIPLSGLVQVGQPDFSQVIHIPKERTNGRSIVAAYSIVIGSQTGAMNGVFNTSYSGATSSMGEAMRAVQQSRSAIPIMNDANIALIAENTIVIRSPLRLAGVAWLDCLLTHNEQLSNIPAGAYRHFADLVVEATKAYIYNNIIIPMDEAEIVGGMGLGQFRSIVEGYSDAEELYQEKLKIWENVSILSDPIQHQDHIMSLMGGLY